VGPLIASTASFFEKHRRNIHGRLLEGNGGGAHGTMSRKFRKAAFVVFFSGVLLRTMLALVNLEANDVDHAEVISIITDQNRIPDKDEVGEAFQPKLYHATVAALWKIIPTQSPPIRIRIGQLVSCTAGVFTLLLALRFFMREIRVSAKVGFLSFSLLALNPKLIGINAQVTNDSFVILFASLALYFGYRFFENHLAKDFCSMTIATILASLSKGNGRVVFMAVLAAFTVACFQGSNGYSLTIRKTVLYASIFLVSFFGVVLRFGPYWEHYRKYGSPFVTNFSLAPFPHVFEKTFFAYPGVTSITDSLLTFRLFDMLRNPVSTNTKEDYPLHRTSLWSQLYGRAHFVHFDAWPPSWQLPSSPSWQLPTRVIRNLGRLIFLCALFPTMLLVVAVWKRIAVAIRWMLSGGKEPHARLSDWLLDLCVFGYIAFIIVYSLRYRDFSVMKAIFIFPGLFGFLTLFGRECDRFYAWCNQKRALQVSADVVFISLLLFYTADAIALNAQLGIRLFR